jgi:hypothetical protein
LSCGVDKNIKMWDARLEASSDSVAGPSQARSLPFYLGLFLTIFTAKATGRLSREGNTSVGPRPLLVSCCC